MPHTLLPAALYSLLATILFLPAARAQTSSAPSSSPPPVQPQSTTRTSISIQNEALTTTTTNPDWAVQTIFFPLEVPPRLAASIITARPNATVYAISCLPGMTHQTTNTQHCNWTTSITLTEGPSTLVYTKTYADEEADPASPAPKHATVNCLVSGPPTAAAVTCTGHSPVAGLGIAASSSVLSPSEIRYATVTVTAGQEKLMDMSTGMGGNGGSAASQSTGGAAAAVATGMGRLGMGIGLMGVFGFGML